HAGHAVRASPGHAAGGSTAAGSAAPCSTARTHPIQEQRQETAMIDNDKAVRRPAKRGAAIAAAVALALAAGSALAQAEAPKYGGTVEIGSVYPTISALSWDLADWNWKQNYDTG